MRKIHLSSTRNSSLICTKKRKRLTLFNISLCFMILIASWCLSTAFISYKDVCHLSHQIESTFGIRFSRVKEIPKRSIRVVCTLVKDEGAYLEEWIEFHLRAGWNRFVIYDDASNDTTLDVVSRYGPEIIEFIPITGFEHAADQHRAAPVKNILLPKCAIKYWPVAEVIGIFDVDEFVYPGRSSWEADDPFLDAARRSEILSTTVRQ
jgi:hypothetical protein